MELRDQPSRPALAQKLGDVTHLSALLRKVRRLSGCPTEQLGDWLLKCAVGRGASHYWQPLQLRQAFASARVPQVREMRELFEATQPKVLKFLGGLV